MRLSAILTGIFLLFASVAVVLPDTAEAARMGGGRSFGSKPYMSRTAPAPSQTVRQPGTQQTQRQAQAQTAQKPGLFGGMGGMLGGLLAGTLLGSLLAGSGFSGGGFLDILLFGLLIFLGLKLFARFRNRQQPAAAGAGNAPADALRNDVDYGMRRDDTAAAGWDTLRNASQGGAMQASAAPLNLPPDFDADDFLRGAKMAYTRLQGAWDRRDLDDIAQFATPAVLDTLRQQMAEDSTPSTTELLLVNASLLGAENDGSDQRAQVYFDVLMREDPQQQAPSAVREIWHFVRPLAGGSWKLDGIQQVD
ncbi:MAG: Tim44-like domain-containing protein [Desulfovibrionaceae bacterium]|nr:Tim44-like domain-containing protein [Desulfovibrionaceae bacterium]